nr:MAG TPA: hypothetical protein [Caudoviricetes sp.]
MAAPRTTSHGLANFGALILATPSAQRLCLLLPALLKIARIASGHAKSDNWVDLAGYAACGGEIEAEVENAKS